MDLKDRKILITGANGGLGRAMAVSLAEHGAILALCERTQELAKAAKAALPEPIRAQERHDSEELSDTNFKMEQFLLKRARLRSDRLEPSCENARIEHG